MTESDAREKWCPFTTVGARGVNRPTPHMVPAARTEIEAQTRCIATDCMAWRWRYGAHDRDGFCGLAGWGEPP